MKLNPLVLSVAILSPAVSASLSPFVSNVLKESTQNNYLARLETNDGHHSRRLENVHRRFGNIQLMKVRRDDEAEDEQAKCDEAFLSCLPNDNCSKCFGDLYTKEIDWASVAPDTPCEDVIEVLITGNHCSYLKSDKEAEVLFCKTFEACALWDGNSIPAPFDAEGGKSAGVDEVAAIEVHEKDEDGVTTNVTKVLDCSDLESCNWEGFHQAFIGDGICHDSMKGCYNSAICGYDGGDCCPESCTNSSYANCGSDGYACKNPESPNCDSSVAKVCTNEEAQQKSEEKEKEDNPNIPECKDNEQIYRVFMYDSFGDGWDKTRMTITPNVNHEFAKFNSTLEEGAEGMEYVCLNKIPTCYYVNVSGGVWGVEASWEVKPLAPGAPALAAGGSPMDCTFAVSGDKNCEVTCSKDYERTDTSQDPQYKDFKDMYSCINDKCVIQVDACEKQESCNSCLDNEVGEYCYGVEPFLALVDCTMCSCTERKDSEFCMMKDGPGIQIIPLDFNPMEGEMAFGAGSCSAKQSMDGLNAVRIFAECTDFDEVGMMISDFDENHFGDLDSFEACAHSFSKEVNHGGHTALGCMQILVNSMNSGDAFGEDDDAFFGMDDVPVEAIAALSKYLYSDPHNFCDCAKEASDNCPLCDSFMNFKTLIYESLDACQSLDEIDCDAWNEFTTPCKNNLIHNHGDIDFTKEEQCEYVKESCGGAGPFPAFRRLDCEGEIPGPSWDFYKNYAGKCLNHDVTSSAPKPAASPTQPPAAPTTIAPVATAPPVQPTTGTTSSSYTPPGKTTTTSAKKPYVPPEDRDSSFYDQSDTNVQQSSYTPPESSSSSSHWIRNLSIVTVLCGCGYYWYKKRSDAFSFVRYRRARNYMPNGGGESEMYSSLSMDSGSNCFEPPTLPPTPDNMT